MAEPMTAARIVTLGAATDVGLRRSRNEDCYRCLDDRGLWLVADGMGGPGGGDVASAIVADTVVEEMGGGRGLAGAAQMAHQNVTVAAGSGQGRPGMGSTLVVLRSEADRYELCWVGDSRAYLWDGALRRLSHDHSVVQSLVDDGRITEAEARVHPERNIITRVLGGNLPGDCGAETVTGTLSPGQQLLLCTDGLTGELDDDQIAALFLQLLPGREMVETLIEAALESGGSDNVTVVLLGLETGTRPSTS